MARSQQWAFLKAVRERNRFSIKDLAAQLGISREHLGRLENGQIENPGWGTVEAWAEKMGVSMQLIGYIRDHPAIDDQAADMIARLVIGGYDEQTIIAECERRLSANR